MPSVFPGALDNLSANKADGTATVSDHAAHHNALADAVNALQSFAKGSLGGDLTGTLPNPSIGAKKITTAMLADSVILPTKVYPQAGGWWQGGADVYLPPNQFSAPASSRLTIPTMPVAVQWEVYMQILVRADSANWTQMISRAYVYNATSQPQADFYAYSESNVGKGFTDWITMAFKGVPFTVPANTPGWFIDPLIQPTPYGGYYNRTYNYNNFHITRVG